MRRRLTLNGLPGTLPHVPHRAAQTVRVQWGLASLAGAWVLIQVTGLVGDSIGWPAWIYRALIVLAAVGFLLTLVLAWYHGETGRQRVSC